ncbi:MAG: phytanoyl-CoA dioxygenase family protein [Planctomycetes bacterium]|nr:phytanoyl-CoA dioxygenase family protein [Planctomycetota bacterium]
MPQATFKLTQDQIDFFRREGYLSIPALTTPEDVARIREIYDRLFTQRAGREKGDQFDLAGTDEEGKEAVMPQILNPAGYAPELNDTLLLANAGVLVHQLFGDKASFGFAHAIYKPPRISPETPWHQDASYWNPDYDYQSISIWVPLQEATLENGCMQFIPRSHVGMNILRHRSINNDPRIHGLELDPAEMHHVKNAVACPLPPGGATVHGGYMMHYAGANKSDIPRRAIILNGGLPGTKRAVPRDLYWNRVKKTLRTERALAAEQAGQKVQPPPRGAGEE